MPYIIDGHNLIGKLSSINLDDPDDEQKLIQLLIGFLSKTNKKGIVFFDRGAPGGDRKVRMGRLDIRFIRHPRNADDAIQRYLDTVKSEAPNFIVVSSDHQLQNAAKYSGARWMKSEEFVSLLSPQNTQAPMPTKPEQQLSPQDIEYWERVFRSAKEDDNNL